ncbi:MAG: tetratricopeptide repeat protein, partial [Gemmatimonadota bacterium]|nr:tetratricopeptide repeat protein [Gemmatimonadota bacterium]
APAKSTPAKAAPPQKAAPQTAPQKAAAMPAPPKAAPAAAAPMTPGLPLEYRAPSGKAYYAQADSGPIARAQAALTADPQNVDKFIALGTAQAGARQMREAVATFTRAIAIAPNNALLYRWRGHRHLSLREFDQAEADLNHALKLDSTVYGAWYHLGIVRFMKGDFPGAADAFMHAQPRAPDAGELAGSTDWLWMSLARAGRMDEASAMLAKHPDSLKTAPDYAYTKRLRMYRQEIGPDFLITAADTGDVQVATLSYGRGNWHLVMGDTATAKKWFRKAVESGGWPGFGFIVAEAELRRLR